MKLSVATAIVLSGTSLGLLCDAFSWGAAPVTRLQTSLNNVPAPTAEGGASPQEIKEAADAAAPPASFFDLQQASVKAAQMAMDDGIANVCLRVTPCGTFAETLCVYV